MKVKVDEAEREVLNWMVAKCEGAGSALVDTHSRGVVLLLSDATPDCEIGETYSPSTDWAQGGAIIEREGISIYPDSAPDMPEIKWSADAEDALCWGGPTPLIAAMRAYVVSKLGSEVEIPEELK